LSEEELPNVDAWFAQKLDFVLPFKERVEFLMYLNISQYTSNLQCICSQSTLSEFTDYNLIVLVGKLYLKTEVKMTIPIKSLERKSRALKQKYKNLQYVGIV
jgi:hypothetical protein